MTLTMMALVAIFSVAQALALYCAWRIGEWYGRGRPLQASATHWTVWEGEDGPRRLFATHEEARAHLGGLASAGWYVCGVVVLGRGLVR